ncbi:cell death regulator Aven [Xenentodon cancila]
MEGRVSRGRGCSWRRGGRGGNDGDSFRGGHRGRGRGGHHRGRGKRDCHRGRGRGGGAHVADFPPRDQDDEGRLEEEDDRMEVFSRRKLESNWDRYKESEKAEPDDDTPTRRGEDYHVMLESAGDSFSQFRFAEEKEWETDPLTASQMSAAFVDLPALAQILQQVPLHQRLNLEAELVQVSTPVELPAVTIAPKQETAKTSKYTPPPSAFRSVATDQASVAAAPGSDPDARGSRVAAEPAVDDGDEELDQLLGLQKPVSGAADQPVSGGRKENAASEQVSEVKEEEVKDEDSAPPTPAAVREEVTEEDLEDWLDSMIS